MHQLRHQPLRIRNLFLLHTRERESLKVLRVPFHLFQLVFMDVKFRIDHSAIELRNITFHAYHGVLAEERLLGNTFVVDLTLESDISKAMATDDLSYTINYAEAYDVVRREMDIPSLLIEHACGRIAVALLREFAVLRRVHVRLAKKNPPIQGADCLESAISLILSREDIKI